MLLELQLEATWFSTEGRRRPNVHIPGLIWRTSHTRRGKASDVRKCRRTAVFRKEEMQGRRANGLTVNFVDESLYESTLHERPAIVNSERLGRRRPSHVNRILPSKCENGSQGQLRVERPGPRSTIYCTAVRPDCHRRYARIHTHTHTRRTCASKSNYFCNLTRSIGGISSLRARPVLSLY